MTGSAAKEKRMVRESGFDYFGFGDTLGGEIELRAKFWRTAKKAAKELSTRSTKYPTTYNSSLLYI